MTDRQQQLAEIEANERWLARFPTVRPDADTLNRIKLCLRLAGEDERLPDAPTERALDRTKDAVHRELLVLTSRRRRRWTFRLSGGAVAAAAAVVLAFVGLQRDAELVVVTRPALDVFVEVLERPADETELDLMELESDLANLQADCFEMISMRWDDPVLGSVEEALDELGTDWPTSDAL